MSFRIPTCVYGRMAVLALLAASAAMADVPRPEHPRPDAYRENWQTLNGQWQFENDPGDGLARGLISGKDLQSKIMVPFCPESKLSGVANTELMKNVWYRRMFKLPASMQGKRVLLHFGGVDYKTWVYVNGRLAGTHIGGSAPFVFDVTPLLQKDVAAENEVVVRVFDDTGSALQPTGKQSATVSHNCVYTRVTGIWQSVWLEAVGSSFVKEISVVPDVDHSRVMIEATIDGHDTDLRLTAEAFLDGKSVGKETVPAAGHSQRLVLNLQEKRLWNPGKPVLYDLKLSLTHGPAKIDELKSYFGLRKVAIEGRRILINGNPVFQRLILDQGFYPDGIWTAPSDEALKRDIELSMAAGYNGARLHQKVFEPRFLYWADKLGYMVWGEFPDWGYKYKPESYSAYVNEWIEVLCRDRNHPAIVGWCPFNETSPAAGEIQQMVWNVTKAVDPTRPALEVSGWSHTIPNPEVLDAHDYDANAETFRQRWDSFFTAEGAALIPPVRYIGQPQRVPDRGVPFMVSEMGGIGWEIEGGWGYGTSPESLDQFYLRYQGTLDALLDNPNMFGFCYTQLTDVEQEHNGLYYYDRRPKFDLARVKAITSRQAAYERSEPLAPQPAARPAVDNWTILVGAIQDGPLSKPYRYFTATPQGDWTKATFDDNGWASGLAPFGQGDMQRKAKIRTPWNTSDIYLRRTFEYDGRPFKAGAVVISYDEDTEVYVNGQKIFSVQGSIDRYEMHDVTETLSKALRKGTNTLAIHTHQTKGSQHIDLGLLVQ